MILIAIPGILLRKGLETHIRELGTHTNLHSVGTEDELNKFLDQSKPSLMFIHSSMIHLLHRFPLNSEENRMVRVLDKKLDILGGESFQADILYLDDHEAQLTKNIKRNLALTEKATNQHNTASELSDREQDIIREIALGKTNKEIADNLFISAHTVITHRKNITRKLGIKTVSGLTVYAILNKIIQMDEI
ncbi:MAG: hypothetical protein GQ527_13070 [Bacteroidales bacterium]|nr:hypothetical protein [Bacteroidales bacterium]